MDLVLLTTKDLLMIISIGIIVTTLNQRIVSNNSLIAIPELLLVANHSIDSLKLDYRSLGSR